MTAEVFRAWTLAAIGRPPRFALEERPVPVPHPQGVSVGIESAVVLSYMNKVLDGSIGYATPPLPFVPGTNAIGRVVAIGAEVSHLAVRLGLRSVRGLHDALRTNSRHLSISHCGAVGRSRAFSRAVSSRA